MTMLLAEVSRAVQRAVSPCERRETALETLAYMRTLGRAALGAMLVALLARPAGARVPYDDRPAYQRAALTAGALVLNVTPVVSGLVAPQCLPGYLLCKVGFALFNTAAAELHLLMSGFGDMAQTRAILYRGWAGDWYLTGRDVAGDHVPEPYPAPPPAEHRGTHTGFEPPPI
jgi:hypothetical protein